MLHMHSVVNVIYNKPFNAFRPQSFREIVALRSLSVVKRETIRKPTKSATFMQFSSELLHHLDMFSILKLRVNHKIGWFDLYSNIYFS